MKTKRKTGVRAPKSRHSNIDKQMLMDNLKRSYAERIRRPQIALETMEKLQKAKRL